MSVVFVNCPRACECGNNNFHQLGRTITPTKPASTIIEYVRCKSCGKYYSTSCNYEEYDSGANTWQPCNVKR